MEHLYECEQEQFVQHGQHTAEVVQVDGVTPHQVQLLQVGPRVVRWNGARKWVWLILSDELLKKRKSKQNFVTSCYLDYSHIFNTLAYKLLLLIKDDS